MEFNKNDLLFSIGHFLSKIYYKQLENGDISFVQKEININKNDFTQNIDKKTGINIKINC